MARIILSGNELGDYVDDGWFPLTPAHNASINAGGGYTTPQGNGGLYFFNFPQNYAMARPFYPIASFDAAGGPTRIGAAACVAASISEFYLRFHFHGNSNTTGERNIVHIYDASLSTILFSLSVYDVGQPNSRVRFWRGDLYSGGSVLSDSGINFDRSTWTRIEIHVKMGAAGTSLIEWRINGVSGTVTTGATVLGPGGQSTGEWLVFYQRTTNNGTANAVDNIAVNDVTGGVNASWPGDGYVVLQKPIRAGLYSELLNSFGSAGAKNYGEVQAIPINNPSSPLFTSGFGNPGSNLSHVRPTVAGQKDTYALPTLPLEAAGASAVRPVFFARRRGTAITQLAPLLRLPGGLITRPNKPLSQGGFPLVDDIIDQNPFTALPFSAADMNAAEVGLQFVA